MKAFMDKDFLLESDTARELFAAASAMPIFDWHCHLSPKEIYENRPPEDIAWLWLAGDHYKWRAMRSCGVPEKYITGDATPHEKFMAWAKIMPYLLGNPLYHWTHLELQRYFDIYEPLSEKTAEDIWNRANAKIAAGGFTARAYRKLERSLPLHHGRCGGQPRISQAALRGRELQVPRYSGVSTRQGARHRAARLPRLAEGS